MHVARIWKPYELRQLALSTSCLSVWLSLSVYFSLSVCPTVLSASCLPLLLQAFLLHNLVLPWLVLVATLLVTLLASTIPLVIVPFLHHKLPL